MKNNLKKVIIFLFFSLSILCLKPSKVKSDPPSNLQCEWKEGSVVSIDPSPELSWVFRSSIPGDRQTAWRIRAATSADLLAQNNPDLWDSGKVFSPLSVAEYRGSSAPLIYWDVETWDTTDSPGGKSLPASFSIAPADLPSLRPHIRTFINFGSDAEFIGRNFDVSMRAGASRYNPDHIALKYVLLATMVEPSQKADDLSRFCVEHGLTEEGIDETMFLHFRADTEVTLHVGREHPDYPVETRIVPGWDPANDRNGDGFVDDTEFASRPVPEASARRMSDARVPIYYWGPPANDFVMNVSHPYYRRFIVEVYVEKALEAGFSGLFSDTLTSVPPGPARSGPLLEFPDNASWGIAVKELAAEIKRRKPDFFLFGNGWNSDPFILDGAEWENWLNASVDLRALSRLVENANSVNERGKILLLQYNPVYDPERSPFGADIGIDKERDRILGLAYYYLAAGPFTYFGFGQHPYDYIEELWFDAVNVDIGTPLDKASLTYVSVPSDMKENILINGSFEDDFDGDGMPDGWIVTPPLVLEEGTARDGNFSVRIDSDSADMNNICSQYVSLNPHTTYTLGVWIRTANVSGVGANVYVYGFDGVDWSNASITENHAPQWRHHAVTFTTSDDMQGRVSFRMRLATGTVWFDNITLVEGEWHDVTVMMRPFEKALVVARPYEGTTEGAFEIELPGRFRSIDSSGSVSEEMEKVKLRPAEAAILLRTTISSEGDGEDSGMDDEIGLMDRMESIDGSVGSDFSTHEVETPDSGGCGCRFSI